VLQQVSQVGPQILAAERLGQHRTVGSVPPERGQRDGLRHRPGTGQSLEGRRGHRAEQIRDRHRPVELDQSPALQPALHGRGQRPGHQPDARGHPRQQAQWHRDLGRRGLRRPDVLGGDVLGRQVLGTAALGRDGCRRRQMLRDQEPNVATNGEVRDPRRPCGEVRVPHPTPGPTGQPVHGCAQARRYEAGPAPLLLHRFEPEDLDPEHHRVLELLGAVAADRPTHLLNR
jgi:hypothetical protein